MVIIGAFWVLVSGLCITERLKGRYGHFRGLLWAVIIYVLYECITRVYVYIIYNLI